MAVGVRLSATDWVDGGWDCEQSIQFSQQLEALDDEWHQQHNRFSEQQKCLFIPVEWLGRIEASLQDVGAQIKQAKQP